MARTLSPAEMRTKARYLRSRASAVGLPYSHDEREVLALLFLPFLLVASAIVVSQSVRTLKAYVAVVAVQSPDLELNPIAPGTSNLMPPAVPPSTVAREVTSDTTLLAPVGSPPAPDSNVASEPAIAPVEPATQQGPANSPLAVVTPSAAPQPLPTASGVPGPLAALAPTGREPSLRAIAPTAIETFEADENGKLKPAGICVAENSQRNASLEGPPAGPDAVSLSPDAFGLRLAQAAESQLGAFVVYDDAYRRISYPMGDVHQFFGVCTDVVVRAYRSLGLDLQTLVHQARSGRGDTNIDHRRTEILRRFFETQGQSLPVSKFAEDYAPGDIVTYYRPQNQHSRSHIAIVSTSVAASGRPMIVHNRGWGPQLEDALFVDEITGHYRYTGPKSPLDRMRAEAPLTQTQVAQSKDLKAARQASLQAKGNPATSVVPASFLVPEQIPPTPAGN